MRVRLSLILLFFSVSLAGTAQISTDSLLIKTEQLAKLWFYRNHDTTYIENKSEFIALKLLLSTKLNAVQFKDKNNSSQITYVPNTPRSLGIGISYKWFSVDLATSVRFLSNERVENDRFFDFQGNVFTSRQYMEGVLQYYHGYSISSADLRGEKHDVDEAVREDVRTINLGLEYSYVFNYGKFSLKAPFMFTERQKKSAGSLMAGVSFQFFVIDGDSTMIPDVLQQGFNDDFELIDQNILGLLGNFGYIHSFIIKEHFFITLSVLPGLGVSTGDYSSGLRQSQPLIISPGVKSMNAIGYNGRKFFAGVHFIGNYFQNRIAPGQITNILRGKNKFFIGYRFGGK